MNKRKFSFFIILVSFFSLTSCLAGCSKVSFSKVSNPDNKVLVTVNGDKITARDVKRELAIRLKQDPSFKITPAILTQQLEIIINRRILIQEATHRKLAEEEAFVNTIRNFWEQTLIRNLLDRMGNELEKSVTVSDAEIQDYYSKMSQQVTFQIVRNTQKEAMDELEQKVKQGQDITWDEKVGPAGIEDITSPVLENAFALGMGEFKVYFDNGVYYLVRVFMKDSMPSLALEGIRTKIETQIRQRKQQAVLENWLKEKRAKAKIVIVANKPQRVKKK